MLSNYKENRGIEFAPTCFNSTTKTVIGHKYGLEKSFQEVFNRIGSWVTEVSIWSITESLDAEYVNIFIYSPLSTSSDIELADKLRNSIKGLINTTTTTTTTKKW